MFASSALIIILICIYVAINYKNKLSYVFGAYFTSVALLMTASALYMSKVGVYNHVFDLDQKIFLLLARTPIRLYTITMVYNASVALCMATAVVFYKMFDKNANYKKCALMLVPIVIFLFINSHNLSWILYEQVHMPHSMWHIPAKIMAWILPVYNEILIPVYLAMPTVILFLAYRKTNLPFKKQYMITVGICIMLVSSCLYFVMLNGFIKSVYYSNIDLTKFPKTLYNGTGYILGPIVLLITLFVTIFMTLYFKPFEALHISKQHRRQKDVMVLNKNVSMMLHTYKNAFCSVDHISDIITESHEDGDTETLKQGTQMLKKIATEQMVSINRIMGVLKNPYLNIKPLDVMTCLCEAVEKSGAEDDVQLRIINNAAETKIMGDEGYIREMCLNLITNSITAMNSKDAENYKKQLDISVINDDEYVVLKFRDNGVGIEKADYKNIFKPFFTTGARKVNSGIGLKSVESVVSLHSGYIYVDSKKGEYAEFTVVLPTVKKARGDYFVRKN